jgi:mono/diheme cytochrome c family protein
MIRPLQLLGLAAGFLAVAFSSARAQDKPVSYFNDVVPLFKKSCTGCHHPGKLKGQLDLTTYEAFKKGGKHGPGFVPGDPKTSRVVEEISGTEPNMPKEGDPLTTAEVALIERWIAQGARDDTPASAKSLKPSAPPTYTALPVISALAFSPDGQVLAVSGYHEVLLHSADGAGLRARLLGESPRIESLLFSPDAKRLYVAGSAPARFGEIQIWDVPATNQLKSFKVSTDSIYGISVSPGGDKIAVGCADKTVRILAAADGRELLKFDNHSDWVFATAFTLNGQRLISGSRDRAIKFIEVAGGQFIDDINKQLEGVLSLARHPKEDVVVYGGELGSIRLYKISDNQGRTVANKDNNLMREFERLPGPVNAVAYSPDGSLIAAGGATPEVRLFNAGDGKRVAALKGHEGAIFTVAFRPATNHVATGGFDGKVRFYDAAKGELVRELVPVPLAPSTADVRAAE